MKKKKNRFTERDYSLMLSRINKDAEAHLARCAKIRAMGTGPNAIDIEICQSREQETRFYNEAELELFELCLEYKVELSKEVRSIIERAYELDGLALNN